MSDSDDTDILLLIPPNYFSDCAEYKVQNRQLIAQCQLEFGPKLENLAASYRCKIRAMMEHTATKPTAGYQFLPPTRKAELNHINARLHTIERNDEYCQFVAPSDVSTISNSTVRDQKRQSDCGKLGFGHSTPKCTSALREKNADVRDYPSDGVLLEIDNFIDRERNQYSSQWIHHSDDYGMPHRNDGGVTTQQAQTTSLPGALNHLTEERSHTQFQIATAMASADSNLISLSEIWGRSGQDTAIAVGGGSGSGVPQFALKEEQLRRQHLEKTVQMLQSRLLEYQQRLSVAIEVDREKDAALSSAQLECKSLNSEVQQLRDSLFKLESHQKDYKNKQDSVQQELAQAVSLATKFQEKNENLEAELNACSRKTKECNNVYKHQLEELEIQVHACKRSEEIAINELNKLKDKLAKVEYQSEKFKERSDELEKDCLTLKHQKEMLQEFHQKQKSRADNLETQRKSLQETLGNLTENETNLKRKLEFQQKSLKTHYQQQLEHVVSQKLKEFQEQLDKTEENLRTDARERERLLAERAVKQLELINEKNELELNLLQEKHNEEVELYRIQLANASKKIDDLELKLNGYKSRRADIAEKLHSVMEMQWQKALEILTSPKQTSADTDDDDGEDDAAGESADDNETRSNKEHAEYSTPKIIKCRKIRAKENNLNVTNKRKEQPEPMDRLQAYIELLLSKSPSDFERLDEILALSTKTATGKLDKSIKRINYGKPPWRA